MNDENTTQEEHTTLTEGIAAKLRAFKADATEEEIAEMAKEIAENAQATRGHGNARLNQAVDKDFNQN